MKYYFIFLSLFMIAGFTSVTVSEVARQKYNSTESIKQLRNEVQEMNHHLQNVLKCTKLLMDGSEIDCAITINSNLIK